MLGGGASYRQTTGRAKFLEDLSSEGVLSTQNEVEWNKSRFSGLATIPTKIGIVGQWGGVARECQHEWRGLDRTTNVVPRTVEKLTIKLSSRGNSVEIVVVRYSARPIDFIASCPAANESLISSFTCFSR